MVESGDHIFVGVEDGKRGRDGMGEGKSGLFKYLVVVAKPVITLVRHNNASLFGIDSGIGKICRVPERTLGDCLEEGRFTDVRKTDLDTQTTGSGFFLPSLCTPSPLQSRDASA